MSPMLPIFSHTFLCLIDTSGLIVKKLTYFLTWLKNIAHAGVIRAFLVFLGAKE